jgi:glutathione S-transferase
MDRAQLIYFDMRGRAEAIRLFLHATGTDFEDRRVVASDEWAVLKTTLPFGALPVYDLDERRLCESHAILRHLGRILTPTPHDEARSTNLDIGQDVLAEAQEDLWRFAWRQNYYDHLESYAEQTLRPRLQRITDWITREGTRESDWFGEAFSHVDCVAFCYLDELDAFFPALLNDFVALSELHRRVASLPGITEYLGSATRPIVFGMGCMGPKVDPRISFEPGLTFANPWTAPIDLDAVSRAQRRLTIASN